MPNYELGPCQIYNNTDSADLGRTFGGVSLTIEETTAELHTDQDGETPVDEQIIGTKVMVETNLAEIALANLALMMKTTVVSNQVKITPNVGTSLFTNAKELVIKPYVNGAVTTDVTKMILIPKGGIKATANMNYNVADQRAIAFTITGYPDSTLSGNPVCVFGASASGSVV